MVENLFCRCREVVPPQMMMMFLWRMREKRAVRGRNEKKGIRFETLHVSSYHIQI